MLRALNISAADVAAEGGSIEDLFAKGFSKSELLEAGFSDKEVERVTRSRSPTGTQASRVGAIAGALVLLVVGGVVSAVLVCKRNVAEPQLRGRAQARAIAAASRKPASTIANRTFGFDSKLSTGGGAQRRDKLLNQTASKQAVCLDSTEAATAVGCAAEVVGSDDIYIAPVVGQAEVYDAAGRSCERDTGAGFGTQLPWTAPRGCEHGSSDAVYTDGDGNVFPAFAIGTTAAEVQPREHTSQPEYATPYESTGTLDNQAQCLDRPSTRRSTASTDGGAARARTGTDWNGRRSNQPPELAPKVPPKKGERVSREGITRSGRRSSMYAGFGGEFDTTA
jgi:hypothetical protein